MSTANRVVVNTGFLYGKMLTTMFISLYSTRLILSALGVIDYGIFTLVGGVIGMLSFLNGAMTISTQRYLSFYLGASEINKLKSIFNSSVLLHLVIGLILILLLELVGIYLFNGILNIPSERIATARIVYHLMVVSTFFTINAVPYDAVINAHENFLFDALIGIFESVIKLGIAIWLIYTEVDKLILYGLLIAGLTIIIRIIKSIYCFRKFDECNVRIRTHFDKKLLIEMFAFAGWNLFGTLCSVVRNEGLAIVLNLFFGVVINAAYGIANQVNNQLSLFSTNMVKALYPQIVKSEGSRDRERMLRLAMLASKLSFFLLAFLAIPIIIETPFILNVWLKKVPENTIIFCRLILVLSMLQQLSVGLMTSITAVGKIKAYQIVIGSFLILNLPLSVGLIKLGFPAYSVFVGSILLECIAAGTRIWFAKKLVDLPSVFFLKRVVFDSILSVLLATLFAILPIFFLEEGILRVFLIVLISITFIALFGKHIALTQDENNRIKEFIYIIINNLMIKN